MKSAGIGTVQTQFRSIARRVPDGARKVMSRKANEVVKLAKLMVPEDTGALMESIRIERGYEQGSNRLFINVVAANQIVTLENGRQIDLNQYALIIHENYGSMNPGKRTIEKQRGNPSIMVGEKFMTRAVDKVRPTVNPEIIQVVNQIIRGETQ